MGIVARLKDQAVVLDSLEHVSTPVLLVLAGVDSVVDLGRRAQDVPRRHAVACVPFDPEVRPLYDLLDLVLLPSRIEGCSQSLLEAMALGMPVIASAAGGNLDLVSPETDGLLVPPLDPHAWASAIERVLGDPALARSLGDAARRTARETFSLTRTVERTLALYRSLVPSAPLAPAAGAR